MTEIKIEEKLLETLRKLYTNTEKARINYEIEAVTFEKTMFGAFESYDLPKDTKVDLNRGLFITQETEVKE